jgi:hypothetical protein
VKLCALDSAYHVPLVMPPDNENEPPVALLVKLLIIT